MRTEYLIHEDFSSFPLGDFPFDKDASAFGEYHFYPKEGYTRGWIDQVNNYTYRGSGPSWIITELNNCHYIESMRIEKDKPHRMFPTLQTGKNEWFDYSLSAKVRRLSTKGSTGVCFCMKNSLNTLVFQFQKNKEVEIVYRHKENVEVLKRAFFESNSDIEYKLEVQIEGKIAICLVNDIEVLRLEHDLVKRGGKIGITSDCPTAFTDIQVRVSKETLDFIEEKEEKSRKELENTQKLYPKMKLWKKIDLKNFGTSRQIRFGHLLGGDEWFIVLAQVQKRVRGDSYGFISCLTAINLDGEILWQLGEPSSNSHMLGKISADMPFQVYDIDNDGVDEVIVGHDFKIKIIDGRNGVVKKQVDTPLSDEEDQQLIGVDYQVYAFDRINPDAIQICNLRGRKRPSDILIKDRYCRLYALDENLNLLWKFVSPKNIGHCPMALDIDGDGLDEILAGYTLLDSHGNIIWTYPIEKDHVDEIVAGKFRNDSQGYFACVAGTEGFFIGDFKGNILYRDRIGHAQRISIGNYCENKKGLEIAVSNFWGHQGIIYLYDSDGNLLWDFENELNGNMLSPVNWIGNGSELILTNADSEKGGLINGEGLRVVEFPKDGHPTLCVAAIDLIGDLRDELVVWDYKELWIYTQTDNPQNIIYKPERVPIYNASNYKGEYSFPSKNFITF